jgi:hypothetical protein
MATHRHTWTGVDFFVADDRPMMRQTCGCGAIRDVRAFDVTWKPPGTTIGSAMATDRGMQGTRPPHAERGEVGSPWTPHPVRL